MRLLSILFLVLATSFAFGEECNPNLVPGTTSGGLSLSKPPAQRPGMCTVAKQTAENANWDKLDYSSALNVTSSPYRCIPDGVTNLTTCLATARAAALAAGKPLFLPAGTYVIDGYDIGNVSHFGDGIDRTILKRMDAAVVGYTAIMFTDSNIFLRDLTIDGNKANNPSISGSLQISNSSYGLTIERVKIKDTRGNGITLTTNADAANNTRTVFRGIIVTGATADALLVRASSYVDVLDSSFLGGDGAGILVLQNSDPPVNDINTYFKIVGNTIRDFPLSGIYIIGARYVGIGSVVQGGHGGIAESNNFVIANNVVKACGTSGAQGGYGISVAGEKVSVTGNIISDSGNISLNTACMGVGVRYGTFTGNIITKCPKYGADAGTCDNCLWQGNHFIDIGNTSSTGVGLGISGLYNSVIGNHFRNIGDPTTGGWALWHQGGESGGGGDSLNVLGFGTIIHDNVFALSSLQQPMNIFQAGRALSIKNNTIFGVTGGYNAVGIYGLTLESNTAVQEGNIIITDSNDPTGLPVASNGTVIIPDLGDVFYITGTTTVNRIYTRGQYDSVCPVAICTSAGVPCTCCTGSGTGTCGKVTTIRTTTQGSGYTSSPTVTFTGGGGTGAVGNAQVTTDGRIVTIAVTNGGSGFTSAPVIGFTGGGGAGAAATATINNPNFGGRTITLISQGLITFTDNAANGNLQLVGNFATNTGDMITLRGEGTQWREVSRGDQ